MEEFEKIDWLPNIEDVVDDKFLNEERLENEGSMHYILNGTLRDPFVGLRPPNNQKQTPRITTQNKGNNGNTNEKRKRGRPIKKKK